MFHVRDLNLHKSDMMCPGRRSILENAQDSNTSIFSRDHSLGFPSLDQHDRQRIHGPHDHQHHHSSLGTLPTGGQRPQPSHFPLQSALKQEAITRGHGNGSGAKTHTRERANSGVVSITRKPAPGKPPPTGSPHKGPPSENSRNTPSHLSSQTPPKAHTWRPPIRGTGATRQHTTGQRATPRVPLTQDCRFPERASEPIKDSSNLPTQQKSRKFPNNPLFKPASGKHPTRLGSGVHGYALPSPSIKLPAI